MTKISDKNIPQRYSYSSIESYKKCPAQFKIRYIDNIRKKDEGIEAFMGKRVHETIEFLYNEVLAERLPLLDTLFNYYTKQWDDSWHNRIAIARWGERKEDYFRLGEDCIARYFRNHTPFTEQVEVNELELNFMLDNDDSYRMKGFIDRLDHDGKGNYEIHDYKTGKRAYGQRAADKDGQLALYQIALEQQVENVQNVELVWHFIRQGIEIRSKRTESQLNKLKSEIKKRIDEIKINVMDGGDFPPKPMILCNWCYYWEECPAQSGTNPYVGK